MKDAMSKIGLAKKIKRKIQEVWMLFMKVDVTCQFIHGHMSHIIQPNTAIMFYIWHQSIPQVEERAC